MTRRPGDTGRRWNFAGCTGHVALLRQTAMSVIHPTAILSPQAETGRDVEIGPYCVIGDGVTLGDGCRLQNHVTIHGPTRIGAHNNFYTSATVGQQSQDLKYKGEPTFLEIGEHNVFREFCTVNRGTLPGSKTIIGSHNHFLAYCHIAHDCIVGNHVIFSNNGTLAGHVIVEDHVILGGHDLDRDPRDLGFGLLLDGRVVGRRRRCHRGPR